MPKGREAGGSCLAGPREHCGSVPHCRAMRGHGLGSLVFSLSLFLYECLVPTGAELALLSVALNDAVGASAAASQSAQCGFRPAKVGLVLLLGCASKGSTEVRPQDTGKTSPTPEYIRWNCQSISLSG